MSDVNMHLLFVLLFADAGIRLNCDKTTLQRMLNHLKEYCNMQNKFSNCFVLVSPSISVFIFYFLA